MKHNYILLSTGPKSWEIIKNTLLITEHKESSENVFKTFETHLIQKPNKWVERLEFASMQQNEDNIDEYLDRLQTKAERCDFNANKEERILEQVIKGTKGTEERRNFSKPNLTLKLAIESIRAYKVTIKDDTCYKDASEIRARIYHEITAKNKRQCTRCGKSHGKKGRLLHF